MAKMHENELEITTHLVYALLKNQCPQWADLPLETIQSYGTDHSLFRLGSDFVIRLPRIHWAINNIDKEYEWLPKIAGCLKTSISEPIFKGHPDPIYPYPWLIQKWNAGNNPAFEKENEYETLAKELADFLNELHAIKLINGPPSRRGVCLKEVNAETRKAILALKDEMDIGPIDHLWNQLMNMPEWLSAPVWVHGDFLPGNILIKNLHLNAVIDFSDVGMGDPACDLIIAWSLFNSHSREIFRANLKNIDDHTWERGRGWALSIALIMLPYYKNSNPMLASLARRMIKSTCLN